MASLNQSTFPTSMSSHRIRKVTWHRTAIMIAAWIEIIVGASFILALDGQAQLIFGATPEGVGIHFARFAGIGLIGLGIASIPPNVAGTRGLLVFNIAVTIFFAWVALATTFRGVILWPVVILHAVLSIVLALSLRHENSEPG